MLFFVLYFIETLFPGMIGIAALIFVGIIVLIGIIGGTELLGFIGDLPIWRIK